MEQKDALTPFYLDVLGGTPFYIHIRVFDRSMDEWLDLKPISNI
jgi:hypothetical protein